MGDRAPDLPVDEQGADADRFWSTSSVHVPAMTRAASRLVGAADAEDTVQQALLTAWRRRTSFDPERGSERAWLMTLVLDSARKSRRRGLSLRRADAWAVDTEPVQPSHGVRVDVEQAVRALPPRQRLAVELSYYVDLSVADTATAMNCSVGTVKSALSDAGRNIRRDLGDEYA